MNHRSVAASLIHAIVAPNGGIAVAVVCMFTVYTTRRVAAIAVELCKLLQFAGRRAHRWIVSYQSLIVIGGQSLERSACVV